VIKSSTITTAPQSSLSFVRNHVSIGVGGGLYVIQSTVKLQGRISLMENRAKSWGGGMYLVATSWISEGPVSVTGTPVRVGFSCCA
jgi:hypothetical protein